MYHLGVKCRFCTLGEVLLIALHLFALRGS